VAVDDSAKWRVTTVDRLKAANNPVLHDMVKKRLVNECNDILKDLGYNISTDNTLKEVPAKLNDLFEKAISFAQTLAGERAVFELWCPTLQESGLKKALHEEYITNINDKYDHEPEEREGYIVFLIAPGLLKRGTEMGVKLENKSVLIKAFVQLEPPKQA
jgi:hypothetical protein